MRGVALAALLLLGWGLGASACRQRSQPELLDPAVRSPPSPSAAEPGGSSAPVALALAPQELTWDYPTTAVGPMRIVVSVPARSRPEERFPVLVLLHGMGEAQKGPERGARGFIDDYWMPRAIERLRRPPLGRDDLLGMVTPARLDELNLALGRRPYRGLVVVCPYTPVRLRDLGVTETESSYADFLVDEVLPRVVRETPALGELSATGIDGVSLGGRGALLVGLARPRAFGVVSALQPAFSPAEADGLGRRAAVAVAAQPALRFRLVTSRRDYYLASTRRIAAALTAADVVVTLLVLEGDHSYAFNRGPGVHELLLFHDRALRGEAAP